MQSTSFFLTLITPFTYSISPLSVVRGSAPLQVVTYAATVGLYPTNAVRRDYVGFTSYAKVCIFRTS